MFVIKIKKNLSLFFLHRPKSPLGFFHNREKIKKFKSRKFFFINILNNFLVLYFRVVRFFVLGLMFMFFVCMWWEDVRNEWVSEWFGWQRSWEFPRFSLWASTRERKTSYNWMEPVYRKNTNADDHSKQTGSNWFELVSVEDREKYREYRQGGTYLKGRKLMKFFQKYFFLIFKSIKVIKISSYY